MYDRFQPTGTLLLVGALNAPSTTSDSITVSWTAPQSPPSGYVLTPVCILLCGEPVQSTPLNVTSSSTSVTYSGILPGSECNITLTAQGSSTSSNQPMVTATTLSESEPTHFLISMYYYALTSMSISVTYRTISSTHWLCCCVKGKHIHHPYMG